MVTREEFKKYMGHIQAQIAMDDVLSDVLVCHDTSGWISTAPDLMDDVIDLIASHLKGNATEDWISWWLWEIDHEKPEDERSNHVWITDEQDGLTYKYTIEDLDDLYSLITDDFEAIKTRTQEDMPSSEYSSKEFTSNVTFHDIFMDNCEYTESDN